MFNKKENQKYKKKYRREVVVQSYIAISPQIIGFFVFSLYPILWVLACSFTDYNGIKGSFTGVANYVKLFTDDSTFWRSILNTFILTAMKMVLELPLAFAFAMLLCSKKLKAKRVFNTLLFLPSVIGVASAGMIFAYIFRTYNGLINNILMDFSITDSPIEWLGQKWTAMIVITLMSTWMTFPINMMYFSGAVAGVPQEIYESAMLDGCAGLRKIISITLPMIAPTFKTIFMLALTGTMKSVSEVMVLTKGGPRGQTNVVMLYLYNMFFGLDGMAGDAGNQIGYAAAGSVLVSIIIGILTVLYMKFTKKADELY